MVKYLQHSTASLVDTDKQDVEPCYIPPYIIEGRVVSGFEKHASLENPPDNVGNEE